MDYNVPEIKLPHLQLRDRSIEVAQGHPQASLVLQIGATLEAELFVLGGLRLGIHQGTIKEVLWSGMKNRPPGYNGEYGDLFFEASDAMLVQLGKVGVFAHLPDFATQQRWIGEDRSAPVKLMLHRAQDHKFEDYHKLACVARDDDVKNIIDNVPLVGNFVMLVAEKLRTDELRVRKENIEYYSRLCNENNLRQVPYSQNGLAPAPYSDYLLPAPSRRPAPPVIFQPEQPATYGGSRISGSRSRPRNLTSTAVDGLVPSLTYSDVVALGLTNILPYHRSHDVGGTQSVPRTTFGFSMNDYRRIMIEQELRCMAASK
ncbi:hypothetical protein IFR05_000118 [Cadophora sp. M221]|nr:hypothetical protein IFR05_000118 [Cadophora sp. M221]